MKKVHLGGKLRPVRFSYLCVKDICNATKLGLNQLSLLGSEIDHIGIMAYNGLKHGAIKNGDEFKYKVKDVEEWLDNEDFSRLNEIFEAFQLDQPESKGK